MNKKLVIYTDGSCEPNPGNGGYAAIILPCLEDKTYGPVTVITGNQPNVTNNIMELKALIKALESIEEPVELEIHSDSMYIVNAFNKGWLDSWISKGWKKADKKPVENQDLWKMLVRELDRVSLNKPTFVHVPGHKGNEYNERCDKLAKEEAAKLT